MGRSMLANLGTMSVILGATVACMANGYPRQREAMEFTGGILIISGFGLLGYALKYVLDHS